MGLQLVWKKGSPAEFLNMGNKIEQQLMHEIAESMLLITRQAAEDARGFTDRIETGAMLNAILPEVEASTREIVGRFGFIGEQAEYFIFQTVTGFEHWLSGEFIEPTFALRDAKNLAEPRLVSAISNAVRRVHL